jgi:predicted alpha/beta superfamily hydrolase
MRRVLFFLIVLAVSLTTNARQSNSVKFVITSPDLSDTSKVFIAGGASELGNWNPAKVAMRNEGNHAWSLTINLNKGTSVEYKFTLGSWNREAADANGQPFQNFLLNVKGDTTVRHSILFWKNGEAKKIPQGKITGLVKYHTHVQGVGLASRDIIVWLPPDYDRSSKQRYPVVYMQDGQNIVDPATSSFGVDWKIDETGDSLIRNKIVKGFIVVGIYNTADRTKEYTPGEVGTAYMKFVVEKVKPLIDAQYRTMPDRKNTIVGGSSAGGIISFMLAWEYPNVFSKAICMSPAFKIEDIDYVKTVIESKQKRNVFFYIDNGGVGLETRLQPGVDAMIDALKQKGYKGGKDYFYVVDATAKHNESDWAKRFPVAIIKCFASKK